MNKAYIQDSVYFYILIRSWNCFLYLKRCIDSVFEQNFKGYKILFIDDASDYTRKQKDYIRKMLEGHIVIFNKKRKFSIQNGYFMIHKYATKKNSVVLILDGDDWLIDKNALNYLSKIYEKRSETVLLSYGESIVWDSNNLLKGSSHGSIPFSNTPYPKKVIKERSFRREPFRVSHPMTFRTFLFKKIKMEDFKDEDGKWLKYSLDLAAYLPMLEMAGDKFRVIKRPMYAYNVSSSNTNIKRNPFDFVRQDLIIRKKKPYGPIK